MLVPEITSRGHFLQEFPRRGCRRQHKRRAPVAAGPVDKAKAAVELAKMDLKMALRFLEDGLS